MKKKNAFLQVQRAMMSLFIIYIVGIRRSSPVHQVALAVCVIILVAPFSYAQCLDSVPGCTQSAASSPAPLHHYYHHHRCYE